MSQPTELLREVELYSSGGRSTTDGIQVILRNRISWSAVQPAATRFGHFHDCCRRSCFANSPSGWEAIQDDRRGGFCEKHPFPGVVLYCPHLWSHSFAPDLPSPHVWLLPGGEISLDTPLSYPVVAWPSNLLSQRWSSGAQTPFLPYGWNGGREAQPPHKHFF